MKAVSAVLLIVLGVRGSVHSVVLPPPAGTEVLEITSGDTLLVLCAGSLRVLTPVRRAYDNLIPGGRPAGVGVDSIAYRVDDPGQERTLIPGPGVFYLAPDLPATFPNDTFFLVEPPYIAFPGKIVQVAVRADDTYIGYLMELINTPFIMTPRLTPEGRHQSDARLGTDCAGLAVYGRRRMGHQVQYLGPSGIVRYLDDLGNGMLAPRLVSGIELYTDSSGAPMPVGEGGLLPGDILHFQVQVSVFYGDCGSIGLLDPDDLVIQSWFDGPHICTIRDNGFFPRPLSVHRWRE